MATDVQIVIGARDMASAVFNKVGNNAKKFTGKIRSVNKSLSGMVFSMQGLTAAIAGGAAFRTVSNELERIDELAKTGRKLGLPTDELVAFRLAGEEMSGMVAGQIDMALQRMTRRVSEAAQGTGEAKDAIAELGLNAEQLNLAGPAESFRQIADAMKNVENPADRLRLAFKLFDSEGASLVTTLEGGSEGLDQMKQRAEELGLTFSDEVASQVERTNDAMHELKQAGTGLVSGLIEGLAPALEVIAEGLTSVAQAAGAAAEKIKEVTPELFAGATEGMLREGEFGQRFGMDVAQGSIAQREEMNRRRSEEARRQAAPGFGGARGGQTPQYSGPSIWQMLGITGRKQDETNKKLDKLNQTLSEPLAVRSVDSNQNEQVQIQRVQ